MKLITLNLTRQNNWNEKKEKIISYLKQEKPDMIFIQECLLNKKQNQAEQLNKALKYKYTSYSTSEKTKDIYLGLCCLSNYPIENTKVIKLKQQNNDKHQRIIQRIAIPNHIFYHVYFSNNDLLAKTQLRETLNYAEKEQTKPIIIGGFNIKKIKDIINAVKNKYLISWTMKNYTSDPLKNETLDYVLIPAKYTFREIESKQENLLETIIQKMKNIYLVRHVQKNPINKDEITKTGQLQIQALKEYINTLDFDKVFSSNMERAKKTIAFFKKKQIYYTDLLNEIKPEKISKELANFLDKIIEENDQILIVAHGNVIRGIISYLTKIPIECTKVISIRNASITRLQNRTGKWKIRSLGCTDHMKKGLITG